MKQKRTGVDGTSLEFVADLYVVWVIGAVCVVVQERIRQFRHQQEASRKAIEGAKLESQLERARSKSFLAKSISAINTSDSPADSPSSAEDTATPPPDKPASFMKPTALTGAGDTKLADSPSKPLQKQHTAKTDSSDRSRRPTRVELEATLSAMGNMRSRPTSPAASPVGTTASSSRQSASPPLRIPSPRRSLSEPPEASEVTAVPNPLSGHQKGSTRLAPSPLPRTPQSPYASRGSISSDGSDRTVRSAFKSRSSADERMLSELVSGLRIQPLKRPTDASPSPGQALAIKRPQPSPRTPANGTARGATTGLTPKRPIPASMLPPNDGSDDENPVSMQTPQRTNGPATSPLTPAALAELMSVSPKAPGSSPRLSSPPSAAAARQNPRPGLADPSSLQSTRSSRRLFASKPSSPLQRHQSAHLPNTTPGTPDRRSDPSPTASDSSKSNGRARSLKPSASTRSASTRSASTRDLGPRSKPSKDVSKPEGVDPQLAPVNPMLGRGRRFSSFASNLVAQRRVAQTAEDDKEFEKTGIRGASKRSLTRVNSAALACTFIIFIPQLRHHCRPCNLRSEV